MKGKGAWRISLRFYQTPSILQTRRDGRQSSNAAEFVQCSQQSKAKDRTLPNKWRVLNLGECSLPLHPVRAGPCATPGGGPGHRSLLALANCISGNCKRQHVHVGQVPVPNERRPPEFPRSCPRGTRMAPARRKQREHRSVCGDGAPAPGSEQKQSTCALRIKVWSLEADSRLCYIRWSGIYDGDPLSSNRRD